MQTDKKVLIFDDNEELLELCTIILGDMGCQVKTSTTTNNILEQVSAYMPDLIFMDNWVPDLSGSDATKQIKADVSLRHIPVIYFSANNHIKELALEAGADDFLEKPFDIARMEEKVKKYTVEN